MTSQTDGSDSSSTPRPDPATSDSAKGSSLPTCRPCAAVFAFLVGPNTVLPSCCLIRRLGTVLTGLTRLLSRAGWQRGQPVTVGLPRVYVVWSEVTV
ncbi:hypothetical protein ACE6H2_019482 [Prunus campanulata]